MDIAIGNTLKQSEHQNNDQIKWNVYVITIAHNLQQRILTYFIDVGRRLEQIFTSLSQASGQILFHSLNFKWFQFTKVAEILSLNLDFYAFTSHTFYMIQVRGWVHYRVYITTSISSLSLAG